MAVDCYSQRSTIQPLVVELSPITTITKSPKQPTLKIIPPSRFFSLNQWIKINNVGFDMNEISFSNWNAGGVSSVSGLIKGNFTRIHLFNKSKWYNELVIRYGINKQDGLTLRKSDDAIRFTSTFGYRKDTLSNWYHSVKFNFNTQFTNGYNYPDTKLPISRLFAPAYTFLGAGAEYFSKKRKLDFYISPLTLKNTLVLDKYLANQGAFGVTKATYDLAGNMISEGAKSKTGLGFLITNEYKKEIVKNINMDNRLSLYSDYLNNFGNIDVDWELQFNLVVNKYVRANVGTHVIYDDNIKITKEINGVQVIRGAKVQLNQVLGIGLAYAF